MMKNSLPKQPPCGGTFEGERPHYFDYWRVGQGSPEKYALDFWVEQAGEFHCKAQHHLSHREYQIERWLRVFYITQGIAQCEYAKYTLKLQVGDLLITPPHHPFVYHAQQASRYHWFALVGRWPTLLGTHPQVLHFSLGYDPILEANFVAIREMLILQAAGYPLQVIGRFYDLMARLAALQDKETTTSTTYPDAVRNALIFLQENYTQAFSATETAASVHLSQSHLRALFEKWVGESPKRYHTRWRMQQARRLLHEQQLSVKATANLLGFSDVDYFSRVYKQIMGISPSVQSQVK